MDKTTRLKDLNKQLRINGLDVYDITLDDGDAMVCISLVDDPAVERNFLAFAAETPRFAFKRDDMAHCITGVAIRANMPVYRRNGDYEYYVRFSPEVIKEIVERYSREGRWNAVDLQHDGQPVGGVIMTEMFIKDSTKGISPKGFEDVEEGSLFVTYKVEDEQLWQQIMTTDTLNGFSIEIYATPVPAVAAYSREETPDVLAEVAALDFSTNSELDKAMNEGQVVNLTVNGNKTLTNAQVYEIGRQNGKNVAIVYADSPYEGRKQWYIYEVRKITNVKPATGAFVEWNVARQGYSWESVQDLLDTEDIQSLRSAIVPANEYERAIIEHKMCIITYRDPSGEDCTLSRQCGVFEFGYNRRGNAALRAYQYYGSTHTVPEGWKMFLISRILSFQVLDYMSEITQAPEGFNYTGPDRDGFNCTLRAEF